MPSIKRVVLLVSLVAFVAGAMFAGGCLVVNDLAGNGDNSKQFSGKVAVADQGLPGVNDNTIARIVKSAGPAVVKISVEKVRRSTGMDPLWDDPFFRYFFGSPSSGSRQPQIQSGLGSGFIISEDGYILTNEHVIDGASKIKVTILGDEKEYEAQLVGSDYDLDLAVLKINAGKKLPFLKLGDSEKLEVGNWVIAIGNPFGFDHTVTVGVISAKGRPVHVQDRYYKNLLQTDAAINPGNSGGPLLNLKGEVVGINTAVAQAQGIGFAIPTSTVKSVLSDLMEKGKVVRPWLGIQMHSLTQELADYFGLGTTNGVVVVGVVPGSPAGKAGLRQGDVILQMDKEAVKDADDLSQRIKNASIGQKILLLVYREGQQMYITVQVGEKPAQVR